MYYHLEKRIKKLELKNQFLTIFSLALMAFVLLTGFTVQNQEKVIRCSKLEIVNQEGQVIAFLGVDQDGSRGLFINDEKERLRVATIHDANQSAFYAFDSSGVIRVGLSQFAHGGGGLALHGENSKGASVLYHKKKGSLTFYDVDGKSTMRIPQKK